MSIKLLCFKLYPFSTCLMLMSVSSTCYAEIFKWVDANGQTHYSDTKADAEILKVEKLKTKSLPKPTEINMQKPTTEATSSIIDSQQKELEDLHRRVKKLTEQQKRPPVAKKAQRAWGGNQPETDATRCALARDIMRGAAVHSNGAPIDAHDREVAQRDIRKFCH
jgi:hypothetical protein